MDLIEPKEFTLACQDGKERVYILSKFPAIAGREIIAKYPLSAVPKLGDYAVNEETMLKLMSYVEARTKDGKSVRLATAVLVDNHVRSWEDLAHIEKEMITYNCSFFLQEKALNFFDAILQRATAKVQEMLTASLQPSSLTVRPHT